MMLPLRFPTVAEQLHESGAAFQRLPPGERFLAIVDLIASGTAILAESPQRAAGARLREAQEEEWRRIHRELFARHGF